MVTEPLAVGAMVTLVKYASFIYSFAAPDYDRINRCLLRYLGLLECSSNTHRRAHAVCPISVILVKYSPDVLDVEDPKIGGYDCRLSPFVRDLFTGQIVSTFTVRHNSDPLCKRTLEEIDND